MLMLVQPVYKYTPATRALNFRPSYPFKAINQRFFLIELKISIPSILFPCCTMGWSITKPSDWEPFEAEIQSLYIEQNWTLARTMTHMLEQRGLKAT